MVFNAAFNNISVISWRSVIVLGNWGAWGAWSTCSETCGSGVLTRYRSCNSPPPANGGSDCLGNNDETTSCLNYVRRILKSVN
jgi:hypothetical protein